ncbi:DUF1329 domain-containing protein [Algiphilus aromaticivorans]|uniref:DUF1329 domain-containing protein n=1 Tax=Algiphilus aromaticivorans TaxID=382454 RepID=UPI000B2EDBCF|nr:DUF1329 domain-containing protein [Algiphilus aromaticivorans]
MTMQRAACIGLMIGICAPVAQLWADATKEQIAKLGGDELNCMGAPRKGTESGVAEYTGKWFKTWPGQSKPHGYEPGPYADEEPIVTITADNYKEHAERLSESLKQMFQKYPEQFRMNVYSSHRDFRYHDWVCDAVRYNAENAKIVDDGLGLEGMAGAHPFPFPENGLEAIWNVTQPHRAWTEHAIYDIAVVQGDGTVSWGKWDFTTMNAGANPDPDERGYFSDKVGGYLFIELLAPPSNRGEINVGYQPNNFANDSTQAWQYNPGTRRVRKAPEIGHDYPVPPAGMRTSDDDYIFNGSPERYSWKLVGKKEMYIPRHNFRVNDPDISYDELIQSKTINPEHVRWELHRVWVIDGYLKEEYRHVYGKRRIYAHEDTWLAHMSDNYDTRGNIWRSNWVLYFYSQESGTYQRGVSLFHDLTSGAYEADYLVNEAGDGWWRLNQPMRPQQFAPEAAARAGR